MQIAFGHAPAVAFKSAQQAAPRMQNPMQPMLHEPGQALAGHTPGQPQFGAWTPKKTVYLGLAASILTFCLGWLQTDGTAGQVIKEEGGTAISKTIEAAGTAGQAAWHTGGKLVDDVTNGNGGRFELPIGIGLAGAATTIAYKKKKGV